MELQEFCDRATKVPFLAGGRDYQGWDCYGLAYRGLVDVFGLSPPQHLGDYEHVRNLAAIAKVIAEGKAHWQKVDSPQVGDVVVLWPRQCYCHVGLMVGGDRFLHVEENCLAAIESVDGEMWAGKVEGYYRWGQHSNNEPR